VIRIAILLSVLAILIALPASAELVQSGQFVMEWTEGGMGGDSGDAGDRQCNLLINEGFETGDLPPWTTEVWYVTDTDPHGGSYCATDVGNYWIKQEIIPTDVSLILEISFWSRQPEMAIQAVDFYYSPTDYDEFIVWPGADWTFHDVTSELRPTGILQAIRVWGYSGGGGEEDRTYVDDFMIDGNIITPVAEGSWGQVKNLFR